MTLNRADGPTRYLGSSSGLFGNRHLQACERNISVRRRYYLDCYRHYGASSQQILSAV